MITKVLYSKVEDDCILGVEVTVENGREDIAFHDAQLWVNEVINSRERDASLPTKDEIERVRHEYDFWVHELNKVCDLYAQARTVAATVHLKLPPWPVCLGASESEDVFIERGPY